MKSMIRVTTRHPERFNILSVDIDPARSLYAEGNDHYASKVKTLYAELGVQTAIWTTPVEQPLEFLEPGKPIEYLLEIESRRVIAYVDEMTWSHFLCDQRKTFHYSRTPVTYEVTSILVAAPIKREEVKEFRRYVRSSTGHCVLVERKQL